MRISLKRKTHFHDVLKKSFTEARARYGFEVSSKGYERMLNPIYTFCGPERKVMFGIQESPGSGNGSDFSDLSDTVFR